MNFSHIFSGFVGMGLFASAQMFLDWNERRTEEQVAQACVKQQGNGKWTPVACVTAKITRKEPR